MGYTWSEEPCKPPRRPQQKPSPRRPQQQKQQKPSPRRPQQQKPSPRRPQQKQQKPSPRRPQQQKQQTPASTSTQGKVLTSYGYTCKNSGSKRKNFCGAHGTSYDWCKVKKDPKVGSATWDHCVTKGDTTHGWHCLKDGKAKSTCGKWGNSYRWCRTKERGLVSKWDYCGSCHQVCNRAQG